MRKPLVFSLAVLLAIGCSDQRLTSPPTDEAAAAFSITDAPVEAGIVMRGETMIAVGWTDLKEGIFVLIGFDPVEYCTGPASFDVIPYQDVILRGGRGTLRHLQGEGLTTSVWPFPGFNCALVTTVQPLATGVSDLVNTDNDFYGDGRSNANAFGFRAHGTLTRTNGADAAFSAHVNYLITANHGFRANSQISLH